MDVYLPSRNVLALKRPSAATRIRSIPLPLFSKRNEPLRSPQTPFFRNLADVHQTSDANGVGLADAQRNVCALQNATRHSISIVVSPAADSTYRIVRLPHIGSFGAARSTTTAPIKCGPASTPVRNAPGFDAQCGCRGGRNQRHKGTRALIPPSPLRLLAPIDAPLRQKLSLLDRFPDTLFCGRSHTRRGQRFINLHNVMISLRNRSPGDDRETSPAGRDFLRVRQPECAAHPRKRNKEEIRPPIMDRAIVSSFSISFLM